MRAREARAAGTGKGSVGEIAVTRGLRVDEDELHFDFVRASGPGGQHVNKTATAVQLRFDVAASPSLPEAVRTRVMRLAGRRVSSAGVLVIEARRHRSQERNRRDAVERLVALLRAAAERPRPRKPTRPPRAARERRLSEKRRRGSAKRLRRTPSDRD